VVVTGNAGATGSSRLTVAGVDRRAQEDARRFTWNGSGSAALQIAAGQPLDISREANGELSLIVEYRVDQPPTAPVLLGMVSGAGNRVTLPIAGLLRAAPAGQWTTMAIPLRCLRDAGVDMQRVISPIAISTAGRLSLSISDVRIASAAVPQNQCGQA
jgi:beta-glucosidase